MTDPNSAWGPKTWNFLHAIALTYPPKADKTKQDAMKSMLESLQGVIPCDICRTHYTEWYNQEKTNPTTFDGQENLFDALVKFHNTVNISKPNQTREITSKQAHDIHGQFPPSGSVCPSTKKTSESTLFILDRRFLILAIVVCVVIGIITHRRRMANNARVTNTTNTTNTKYTHTHTNNSAP
jgi:hypothetical protein